MAEYQVLFKVSADKALRKLPAAIQKRIVAAVDDLKSNPRPHGSEKMQGIENHWRIRVGDYRVVYTIRDKELVILVVRVAHRKDVYKGL